MTISAPTIGTPTSSTPAAAARPVPSRSWPPGNSVSSTAGAMLIDKPISV